MKKSLVFWGLILSSLIAFYAAHFFLMDVSPEYTKDDYFYKGVYQSISMAVGIVLLIVAFWLRKKMK